MILKNQTVFTFKEGSNTGNKKVAPMEDKMLYQKLRASKQSQGPTLVLTLLHIINPSVRCVLLASKFLNRENMSSLPSVSTLPELLHTASI
jgi:hypothetical protein